MRTLALILLLASSAAAGTLPALYVSDVNEDTVFTDIGAGLTGAVAGNALWFDYDNDGDLDILVTGSNDTVYFSTIYRNDGGTFTDIHADLLGLETEHGVSYGDYDNDGDLDLAVQGRTDPGNNAIFTKIYRNDAGSFVDIGAPLLGLNGGSTVWVDYDMDGRLDLFVCGSTDAGYTFHAKLYHNAGGGNFEEVLTGIAGVWGSSASWGDFDGDGDMDLFLLGYGYYGVMTRLYRNDGWVFTNLGIAFPAVNSGSSAWIDIDNDGDLDLAYSGAYGSGARTVICRNLGFAGFSIVTTAIKDLSVSAMAWADYDNDGDLDLAESGSENFGGANPTTKIYRNDDGTFTDIGATIPGTWFGSLAWGDYDNDGRLDLLVTGGTTPVDAETLTHPITRIYRNGIGTPNTPPSVPANAIATVGANQLEVAWDPATDAQTPPAGLTYNVRVGTTPGGFDVVNAFARPSGWRRLPGAGNSGARTVRTLRHLPAGTYYWSVQGIDNAFAGSSFAGEQEIIIPDSATDVSSLPVGASWNLLALPRDPADPSASALFPTATSPVYAFTGGGYAAQSSLRGGAGYWVKFGEEQTIAVTGAARYSDTLALVAGWNIIGGLGVPVPVSSIESIPPGMTTSPFFAYDLGYAVSDVIAPGRGYWVKMPSAGSLVLRSTGLGRPNRTVRVTPTGELPPGLPAGAGTLPAAFRLEQNFPNPFNPATSLRFSLAAPGAVRLVVYNILGEEVARPLDDRLEAGTHVASFDGAALPSGVYTARLTAGSSAATIRMLLVR